MHTSALGPFAGTWPECPFWVPCPGPVGDVRSSHQGQTGPLASREPKIINKGDRWSETPSVVAQGEWSGRKACLWQREVRSAVPAGPGRGPTMAEQVPPQPTSAGLFGDPAPAPWEECLVLWPPRSSLSPHWKWALLRTPFLAVAHLQNPIPATFTLRGVQGFL